MAVAIARTTVCIYVRVSDQRQVQGTSIEMQQVECRAWCKANGYFVERVFVEPGVSAKTTNRPVLQEMMNYIASKPDGLISAVVVWKFDRFTRSFDDGVILRLQLGCRFSRPLKRPTLHQRAYSFNASMTRTANWTIHGARIGH